MPISTRGLGQATAATQNLAQFIAALGARKGDAIRGIGEQARQIRMDHDRRKLEAAQMAQRQQQIDMQREAAAREQARYDTERAEQEKRRAALAGVVQPLLGLQQANQNASSVAGAAGRSLGGIVGGGPQAAIAAMASRIAAPIASSGQMPQAPDVSGLGTAPLTQILGNLHQQGMLKQQQALQVLRDEASRKHDIRVLDKNIEAKMNAQQQAQLDMIARMNLQAELDGDAAKAAAARQLGLMLFGQNFEKLMTSWKMKEAKKQREAAQEFQADEAKREAAAKQEEDRVGRLHKQIKDARADFESSMKSLAAPATSMSGEKLPDRDVRLEVARNARRNGLHLLRLLRADEARYSVTDKDGNIDLDKTESAIPGELKAAINRIIDSIELIDRQYANDGRGLRGHGEDLSKSR